MSPLPSQADCVFPTCRAGGQHAAEGAILTEIIFDVDCCLQVAFVRSCKGFRPLQESVLLPDERSKSSVFPDPKASP